MELTIKLDEMELEICDSYASYVCFEHGKRDAFCYLKFLPPEINAYLAKILEKAREAVEQFHPYEDTVMMTASAHYEDWCASSLDDKLSND